MIVVELGAKAAFGFHPIFFSFAIKDYK